MIYEDGQTFNATVVAIYYIIDIAIYLGNILHKRSGGDDMMEDEKKEKMVILSVVLSTVIVVIFSVLTIFSILFMWIAFAITFATLFITGTINCFVKSGMNRFEWLTRPVCTKMGELRKFKLRVAVTFIVCVVTMYASILTVGFIFG